MSLILFVFSEPSVAYGSKFCFACMWFGTRFK
jgi:hypothetical protein